MPPTLQLKVDIFIKLLNRCEVMWKKIKKPFISPSKSQVSIAALLRITHQSLEFTQNDAENKKHL